MMGHVREITEAASRIGQSDLSSRVPNTKSNDEIGHLARTLNHMLDRIENSVHQLHTITDSLAHDLRSPSPQFAASWRRRYPTTCGSIGRADRIRNRRAGPPHGVPEHIARRSRGKGGCTPALPDRSGSRSAGEEHGRPLRAFHERQGAGGPHSRRRPVEVLADPALLHRVIANLLDNELKHLPASCTVWLSLESANDMGTLTVEDNGAGFDVEIGRHLFDRRVKGRASRGHGLGLAFVEAVVRVHGGTVTAANRAEGGARLTVTLPLCEARNREEPHALALVNG